LVQKGQVEMAFEYWARGHPGLLQMSEFDAVKLAIDEAFCQNHYTAAACFEAPDLPRPRSINAATVKRRQARHVLAG
jgi:hypothetical protein